MGSELSYLRRVHLEQKMHMGLIIMTSHFFVESMCNIVGNFLFQNTLLMFRDRVAERLMTEVQSRRPWST
jgi:hypothetical protein